jgi:hypothetical protein
VPPWPPRTRLCNRGLRMGRATVAMALELVSMRLTSQSGAASTATQGSVIAVSGVGQVIPLGVTGRRVPSVDALRGWSSRANARLRTVRAVMLSGEAAAALMTSVGIQAMVTGVSHGAAAAPASGPAGR